MKILLCGEGKTELGGWASHPGLRSESPEAGILESLLKRVKAEGWSIENAVLWKDLKKRDGFPRPYRAHNQGPAEARNILNLVKAARDQGCTAVVFSRDRDCDSNREQDVVAGIERARKLVDDRPFIAGGMAVESIESWVASLQGTRNAEASGNPKALLKVDSLAEKRHIVESEPFPRIPEDAKSLRSWLSSVASLFGIPSESLFQD